MSLAASPTPSEELVETFTEFFKRYHDDRDHGRLTVKEYANAPSDHEALLVDYDNIFQYDPQLAEDWLTQPQTVRTAAEAALAEYPLPIDLEWSPNVHLVNIPENVAREIGAFDANNDDGALRCIEGQLTKKTKVRPLLKEAVFVCQRCGAETTVTQSRTGFQQPYQCESCERQGPFKLHPRKSTKVNHQMVRVQMPPEKAAGGSSEHLDVALVEEVVGAAEVGDRVSVSARISASQPDENADAPIMEWQADGQHVELEESDWEDLDIDEHEDRIKEVAASGSAHEQIVESVMPTHEGDDEIKLAIALQMFGGVTKRLPDGSRKRGDSHILLVGDPGTNKSGLLKYAKKLAPRSIYTSGKSSSGVGLTAAAVRDDFGGGGWTLEGGAMVRANNGTACIDEFDKMDDGDRGSMFEALAEQAISVSKAGINATLPAKTRVLAAANPDTGRFDTKAPIGDQINLDPALISRFDLIFIVTDQPDTDVDASIADTVNTTAQVGAMLQRDDTPAQEKRERVEPVIGEDVMRAYIAYARQTCTPVLSDAAADRVKQFYVDLRSKGISEDDPVPVTARKLEAVHRLSEASARIRLSETVTVEDVERAVSLVRSCLSDIGIDPETGEFDADVVETGTSHSQRDRISTVTDVIEELEGETARGAPLEEVEMVCAEEFQIPSHRVESTIEKLRREGRAYTTGSADDHVRLT